MTASSLADIVALLIDRVEGHYGPGERVDRLQNALAPWADDARAVDAGSLSEIEAAAQLVFRHLELVLAAGLLPEHISPGWPPPDIAAERRSGAGIAAVERRTDGVAVIRLTALAPATAAAPLLAGAFQLVRGAAQLDLDLRTNVGGDPATVALIVDWLADGPPRHLFDVAYRDVVRPWWTAGAPLAAPPTGSVRALIGPQTSSSGEALAWCLQRQGLAVLAGEPTRGAADHVVPIALAHDVHALIPEARVVAPDGGLTWEGTGVQPDGPLSADDLAR